jgi:SET domain-containing protein
MPTFTKEQLLAALSLSDGRRRGVNAGRRILPGELIEMSPVIVIPPADVWILAETDLAPYLEPWPSEDGAAALPLGFAPMYNDSATPNTTVVRHVDAMRMDIVATAEIAQGEEMTVPRRWRINGWAPEKAEDAVPGDDD